MLAKAAAGLLIVLATATPAASQDSRAAQLQRQRAEKANALTPYQPALIAYFRRAGDGWTLVGLERNP